MDAMNNNESPHDYRVRLDKKEIKLFRNYKVKNILEVCCGNGRNLIKLNKLGFHVTGIENSKFLGIESNKNIEVIEHPIFSKNLPFEDESFDCIYSYQNLNHNYKDKIVDLFKEIFRVMKKGGIFSIKISDMDQFNVNQIKNNIYEECDPEFPKIRFKKLEKQTYAKLEGKEKGIPHYLFYKEELVNSLKEIGFKLINIRTIKWNIVANFSK